MMLRLHRLWSEPRCFEPITFGSGINLILGEKADAGQPQGRKVNGVGKSMCVEFLHFALLRQFEQTRVAQIPEGKLPTDLVVILDLAINGHALQVRRTLARPDQVAIVRDGAAVTFGNLDEATRFLGDLLFAGHVSGGFASFRGLISLLMRDEESEFSSILRTMPVSRSAPNDPAPHLYLLGFDLAPYRKLLETIKELEQQARALKQLKADLTRHGEVQIQDIAAELNEEQKDVEVIQQGLNELRAEPAFAQVEADLNRLETRLGELRAQRKGISFQIDQIRSLPQPEVIDETDIQIVYDRIRAGLGALVMKSLDQARAFKQEVERFQGSLLTDELKRLEGAERELTTKIRQLSEEHAALVKQIDRKGALKELSAGISVAMHKHQDYYRRTALFDQYRQGEQRKEDLRSDRQLAFDALRKQQQEHQDVEAAMNYEVASIHERIMGIRKASFTIQLNSNASVKHPVSLDLRIDDDGSHSIERTKVFIYDCALMFSPCTQGRHPRFLLHDNIFDVDQDTLVQCLNYLNEQADKGEDFQYVLTLNREKIEEEERKRLIKLDVSAATRATLTKAAPFLGFRYQERRRGSADL